MNDVRLDLVVNVFTCKQAQIYPESGSQWSKTELIKLLALTGAVGKLSDQYQYDDVVNLLLDRLNVQKPILYAMVVHGHKSELVLKSQSVEISDQRLRFGPFAELKTLSSTRCEEAWSTFIEYMVSARLAVHAEIATENPLDRLDMRDMQIAQLKAKIAQMEEAAKQSENGRLRQQFEEANRRYQACVASKEDRLAHDRALEDQNRKLWQEHEQTMAKLMLLQDQRAKWKQQQQPKQQ